LEIENCKLKISDPVTSIPLVGPSYTSKLKRLDIATVEDLLHHYPFRYDDFSQIRKINELIAGEMATVTATVLEVKNVHTRGGKRLIQTTVADETSELQVVWFNPYVIKNVKEENLINLSGSLAGWNNKPALISPAYEIVTAAPRQAKQSGNRSRQPLHTGRLVPIYPETRGVSSKWLRSRIAAALKILKILAPNNSSGVYTPELSDKFDFLPPSIKGSQNLIDLNKALRMIHFPNDRDEINKARRRLGFDELFLMQIKALKRRAEWQEKPLAHKFRMKNEDLPAGKAGLRIKEFINSLPFELTNAQKRAVDEILKDLAKNVPMNRLLEGDVGSGKTVVAAVALYATHLNGFQSALMVPTEVLAEQHYKEITKMLGPFGVKVGLRTGSKKGNSKKKETNAYSLVPSALVGTHALLFNSVKFKNLGLIVIDEQHRFGVKQRAKLLEKSVKTPHLLTMTATPIPRSLALTAYGDLDLSVLDEMPPDRKEVATWVVPNRKRKAAYNWVREQIKEGNRAFVICPLIEESEAETMQAVKAATVEFERLSKEVFPDLKLALLHGRIKSKEKNKILKDFKNGKYDILVSTQVVEVGIDIPTATIIIIEGAERFGLASLHQLRGRVGRSTRQSYCLLFTSSPGRRSYKRLKAMEETNDGFKLAKIDLKIRGPGEIYGVKQHGIEEFKIASLSDIRLIETTRNEATKILEKDPSLETYPNLKEKLERISEELVEPN